MKIFYINVFFYNNSDRWIVEDTEQLQKIRMDCKKYRTITKDTDGFWKIIKEEKKKNDQVSFRDIHQTIVNFIPRLAIRSHDEIKDMFKRFQKYFFFAIWKVDWISNYK